MARPDKVAAVEEIADRFRGSNASVVTEFRGLTVSQLKALRRALTPGATYQVAKNTLVRRAAADAGVSGLDELLVGPTAIAFVTGEAVDAAKALRNFARDNKALVIKGGIMDGRPLTVAEVNQLADLESREVLLAKLAGAMMGNLAKAAGLFAAPASQLARLAAALGDKRAAASETSTEAATDTTTETTETDTTDTTQTTETTETTEPEPAAASAES
jgi:large subunit ribosomal protein L10